MRTLEVLIIGNVEGLRRAYEKAGRETETLGSKFAGLGKMAAFGAGAAGVGLLATGLEKSVEAAKRAQVGQAQLEAQIKASGAGYDVWKEKIDGTLGKLTQLAGFSDAEMKPALTRLVRASGDTGQALSQMGLVADLARARHLDLSKAADVVGKVIDGNTGILKRYGVEIQKGATVTEALGAAHEKFAGQAKAYGDTAAGAQDKFRAATDNLEVSVGNKLLPVLTSLMTWAAAKMPAIQQAVESAMKPIGTVFRAVWSVIQEDLIPIFEKFAQIWKIELAGVRKAFDQNAPAIHKLLDNLKTVVGGLSAAFLWLANNVVIPVLKPLFMNVLPAVLGITIGIIDKLFTAVDKVIGAFKWVGSTAATIWKTLSKELAGPLDAVTAAFNKVGGALQWIYNTMKNIIDKAAEVAKALGSLGGLLGKLPGLAAGGPVVAGQAYIVGENGPELFIAGQNGSIIPNSDLSGLPAASGALGGGTGGGLTINLTVQGSVVTERELVDSLRQALMRTARGLASSSVTPQAGKLGLA